MKKVRSIIDNFVMNSFACVMATGIVCIAAEQSGLHTIAIMLFIINNIIYFLCFALAMIKLYFQPLKMLGELTHHQSGPGYLTLVAATNILGIQYIQFTSISFISINLFWVSNILYLLFMLFLFIGMTVTKIKPTLADGLDGTWLLCTVSGCSIIILGDTIKSYYQFSVLELIVLSGIWGASLLLYFVMIGFIFYRWFFQFFDISSFSPAYWINMGALAISSLAGVHLTNLVENTPLGIFSYFILSSSFFLWLMSIWWGGFLISIFIYRVIKHKLKFQYSVKNWSAIFPLGMCCVSSLAVLNSISLMDPTWKCVIEKITIIVCIIWFITFLQGVFSIMSSKEYN